MTPEEDGPLAVISYACRPHVQIQAVLALRLRPWGGAEDRWATRRLRATVAICQSITHAGPGFELNGRSKTVAPARCVSVRDTFEARDGIGGRASYFPRSGFDNDIHVTVLSRNGYWKDVTYTMLGLCVSYPLI